MSVKYEFLVGARDSEEDGGQPVVVYAETYAEAMSKAIRLAGYRDSAGKAWLQRIEEQPWV